MDLEGKGKKHFYSCGDSEKKYERGGVVERGVPSSGEIKLSQVGSGTWPTLAEGGDQDEKSSLKKKSRGNTGRL